MIQTKSYGTTLGPELTPLSRDQRERGRGAGGEVDMMTRPEDRAFAHTFFNIFEGIIVAYVQNHQFHRPGFAGI